MKNYRFSRTYIAAFMYRFAFLLFVPFLQGLLFADQGIFKLFTLYGTDLAVVVFLLAVAIVRYKKGRAQLDEHNILIKKGALLQVCDSFSLGGKLCITFTETLLLRIFRASRMKVFAGTAYGDAYLGRDSCKDILSKYKNKDVKIFASGIFRSLLMSVSFSNALTGLLAAVPILRRASVLIGARQTALILQGAELPPWLRLKNLPPALSKFSTFLLFAWIIGMSTEFFREYRLRFYISETFFRIEKGLMTRTKVIFSRKSIQAVATTQSLMMFLLGLYSMRIYLNSRPVGKLHIMSASSRSRCDDLETEIFGTNQSPALTLKPCEKALFAYTWLPLTLLLIISVIRIISPDLIIILIFFATFGTICLIWFFFRIFSLYTSFVRIKGGIIEVRFYKGLNFVRTVFEAEKLNAVEVRQSLFQRINKRCSLVFSLKGTKSLKIKIKHLDKSLAIKLVSNIYP